MGSGDKVSHIEAEIKQWQNNLAIAKRDGNKSNIQRAKDMIASKKEELKLAKKRR